MNRKKLEDVWRTIKRKKKCGDCPLHLHMKPLIMKAEGSVRGMVITEGPNREEDPKNIASFGTHPTYTFLYTLFSGKAKFLGKNANVYWTHLRKCFLRNGEDRRSDAQKTLGPCTENYLEEEIQAVKPRFIVAVGRKALKFFVKHDDRLSKKIEDVVFRKKGKFPNVKLNDLRFNLFVLPHPSGLNQSWVDLPPNAYEILEKIRKGLSNSLSR